MSFKLEPKVGDLIFTYGTLRRGQRAFYKLEGKTEYLALTTMPGVSMYSLGGFPGLKLDSKATARGELFKVTDASLFKTLDQYEGYPHMYDRVQMETPEGTAWVYIFNGEIDESRRIPSGDWLNHGATG